MAVLAVVVSALAACGSGSGDESLEPAKPTTTFTGPPITVKDPTFHVSFYLAYPGSELKVLEVTALTSPNVTSLGAVTVWPRDLLDGNVGGGPKFPPPDIKASHTLGEVVPASETTFVPKGFDGPGDVAVSVGFRLEDQSVGAVNGVRIVYLVDGKRKVEVHRTAVIACVKPKSCRGPGFNDDPDFATKTLRTFGLLPVGDG